MPIVIIAERKSTTGGDPFRTFHQLPHTPIQLAEGSGWDGSGAGLSDADYVRIIRELMDSACNIHGLRIDLID